MINRIVVKGMVASLALTGSLAAAPVALADSADPAGAATGYGLLHAGHDHGDKPDKPKPKPKKPKDSDHHHQHHHHHHHHYHDGDSAHAGGGYDSHREHPRNW